MRPVFIGGCGRSGTTMLGALLGSRTKCSAIPEFQFKIDILGDELFDSACQESADIIKLLNSFKKFRIWPMPTDTLDFGEQFDYLSLVEAFNEIAEAYCRQIGEGKVEIWVDHTLEKCRNFGLLSSKFPESKLIHIVRDGRAVAASGMGLNWGPNTINRATL